MVVFILEICPLEQINKWNRLYEVAKKYQLSQRVETNCSKLNVNWTLRKTLGTNRVKSEETELVS